MITPIRVERFSCRRPGRGRRRLDRRRDLGRLVRFGGFALSHGSPTSRPKPIGLIGCPRHDDPGALGQPRPDLRTVRAHQPGLEGDRALTAVGLRDHHRGAVTLLVDGRVGHAQDVLDQLRRHGGAGGLTVAEPGVGILQLHRHVVADDARHGRSGGGDRHHGARLDEIGDGVETERDRLLGPDPGGVGLLEGEHGLQPARPGEDHELTAARPGGAGPGRPGRTARGRSRDGRSAARGQGCRPCAGRQELTDDTVDDRHGSVEGRLQDGVLEVAARRADPGLGMPPRLVRRLPRPGSARRAATSGTPS